MRFLFYAMAVICMALVSGCASQKKIADDEPLTPMITLPAFHDPDNGQFMDAVAAYIHGKDAPDNTRFEFTRLDLDNDGRREGIVLLKSPHQYWCDLNGCSMVVFKAGDNGFTPMSTVFPVRGPLTVSSHTTNGWKDIIVRVSGRMYADTKDVALQFNGKSYPPQPAFQPPVRYAYNDIGGVRIFP